MHDDPTLGTFASLTSKIERGNMDIYISPVFDRKALACVTVKVGKYGSDTASFVTGWYGAVNVALAHGVPWEVLRDAAKAHKDSKPTMLHVVVVEIDRLLEEQEAKQEAHEQIDLTPSTQPVTVKPST